MTTQIYNPEMVELLRSTFPDRQRYAQFQYNVAAQWYDYPLENPPDGEHFNNNNATYPATWTEADAAGSTNTNAKYGFWFLAGTSDLTWKYRKQLSIDIENDFNDLDWISFLWGPVIYRDTQNPNDETYYFGVYADNAGTIDEDTFVRVALNWDSAAGNWQARSERKDGATQTDGSWFVLSQFPTLQPVYIRNTIRYRVSGDERVRGYLGSTIIPDAQIQLMNDVMNITWGQVWLQMHMSRGGSTGVQNYLLLGAVDWNLDP